MRLLRRAEFIMFFLILVNFLIQTNSTNVLASEDLIIDRPLSDFVIEPIKVANAPKIDGMLDDECWQKSKPITEFIQLEPAQEEPATEKTICYFAYDNDFLYFGANCFDCEPQKITASICRRDDIFSDDWIILLLDTYNDQRSAYEFMANPYGVQGDATNSGNQEDWRWDGKWQSAATRTDSGWSIEMVIPFNTLRFSKTKIQTWRFQIVRYIARKGEKSSYVPIRKIDNFILSRTAELQNMRNIRRGHFFDPLPYITEKSEDKRGAKWETKLGGDLKWGLGPNLTVDLTINPDYGQVEADPDRVNLTLYELYYEEKRPFFLERMDIFTSPIDLFYSRRITDPVAGCKLTGKMGGYTVGILDAVNDNKYQERKENFGVLRIKRDVLSKSEIGIFSVNKDWKDGYNRALAGDWRLIYRSLIFTGQLARSWTKGVSELSWRGDADIDFYRNNFDLGFSYRFWERNFQVEPGFVIPYIMDSDFTAFSYRRIKIYSSYEWQINKYSLRWIHPSVTYYRGVIYGGRLLYESVYSSLNISLVKNINFSLRIEPEKELWNNKYYNEFIYSVSVDANPTGYFGLGTSFSEGKAINYQYDFLGWNREFSFWLSWKPKSNIEIVPEVAHASQYRSHHGERLFNQWVGLGRISYFFTHNFYLKLFLQGNTHSHYHIGNALIGYTFRPGSSFYLAYNSGWDNTEGNWKKKNQVVFAKISYLLEF
jgi:hypothetical protein